MKTARLTLVIAGLLVAVAGCRVKNPPDLTAIKQQALPTFEIPPQWTVAGMAAGVVGDNWLATFADDQLKAAVAEGIAHNADLTVAATRVDTAMLYAKLAGAKLWPAADLVAAGGGQMSGDGSGLQGGALSLSWELDLWARVRYGRSAAAADAAAMASDYEYARQSIAAAVAKNWFLAIEAGLQAAVARNTIDSTQTLVRLAEDRSRVGVGSDEDVFVARSAVSTYQDSLRQIEFAREQAIRALEILLGRYPAATTALSPQMPSQPGPLPGGLPSELLERRPDVRAAERRIAAAFYRVGEAKAARLPKIALTMSVNSVSSDLFVLQDRDNPVWSFGANLLQPVFQGGALKTQVEIRTAEQKQAVANYAVVGQRAFSEVENALAAEIVARQREEILTRALADSQRALEIVQTQFKVGSTDLRFVTQRQLALNATQSALVRVQTEQRVQRVNVHLALGGTFESKPEPEQKKPE